MQSLAQSSLLAEPWPDSATYDNFPTYASCSHSSALVLSSPSNYIATPYTKKKIKTQNTLHSYLTVTSIIQERSH